MALAVPRLDDLAHPAAGPVEGEGVGLGEIEGAAEGEAVGDVFDAAVGAEGVVVGLLYVRLLVGVRGRGLLL